MKIMTAMLTDN